MRSARPKPPVSLANLGIGHVGLRVSNLDESRMFYRKILGLKNKTKGARQAFVQSGSDLLVLNKGGDSQTDFHFGFRLGSPHQVNEWKRWLIGNNIRIYEDIDEEGHPRSLKFKDPDGYWIEIASSS
jgi:catechol 2,3-dioxygenase-like lactoylglutathione lyase family enzyme